MRNWILSIAIALGCAVACCQGQDIPTPLPDPVPDADVMTGPISDAIERRLAERFEKLHEERFAGLLDEMREARAERTTIIERLQSIQAERNGLLARFDDIRQRVFGIDDKMEIIFGRWTPLQNLVERLTELVYKLFWLVIALGVLAVVSLALMGALYAFIRRQLGKIQISVPSIDLPKSLR